MTRGLTDNNAHVFHQEVHGLRADVLPGDFDPEISNLAANKLERKSELLANVGPELKVSEDHVAGPDADVQVLAGETLDVAADQLVNEGLENGFKHLIIVKTCLSPFLGSAISGRDSNTGETCYRHFISTPGKRFCPGIELGSLTRQIIN